MQEKPHRLGFSTLTRLKGLHSETAAVRGVPLPSSPKYLRDVMCVHTVSDSLAREQRLWDTTVRTAQYRCLLPTCKECWPPGCSRRRPAACGGTVAAGS